MSDPPAGSVRTSSRLNGHRSALGCKRVPHPRWRAGRRTRASLGAGERRPGRPGGCSRERRQGGGERAGGALGAAASACSRTRSHLTVCSGKGEAGKAPKQKKQAAKKGDKPAGPKRPAGAYLWVPPALRLAAFPPKRTRSGFGEGGTKQPLSLSLLAPVVQAVPARFPTRICSGRRRLQGSNPHARLPCQPEGRSSQLPLSARPPSCPCPSQARPNVNCSSREIASAAGAAWRALSPDLKAQYEARGEEEKVRTDCFLLCSVDGRALKGRSTRGAWGDGSSPDDERGALLARL